MAGPDPAIDVIATSSKKETWMPVKPGHDGEGVRTNR